MRRSVALYCLVALSAAGCGEDDAEEPLTVSAASSLTDAFETYGDQAEGEERFSFAGSDELAAQIRSGAPVDVFASANTSVPEELHSEGLVERPVEFAFNELVLAVPLGSDIRSLDDVARGGVDLVVGADGVPVGGYAREVIDRLPPPQRDAIVASIRSEEPDVKGIVGKLVAGAADAGFIYQSDARAAVDDLTAIALPKELRPDVTYGVAVVADSDQPAQAQAFVRGLRGAIGSQILLEAGFGVP